MKYTEKGKKLRYIHAYNDRHGKARLYYACPGQKRVPLRGPLYSEEFWIDYRKAEKGVSVVTEGAGQGKTVPGSINSLMVKYYQSAEFTNLATATQRNYKSVLEAFREEHGPKPLAGLKREHINAILDKRAKTSTAQAKNLRKRLSTLMQFGIDHGLINSNPMQDVKKVKHEEVHYEMWEDADIDAFRTHWGAETPQRLALEILVYTGLRRSDAVKLGPQHLKDGIIKIKAQKTGAELNIPVHPTLMQFLTKASKRSLAYIVTQQGRSRSVKAFTNWIADAADKAGLPPHRSPHGLRRAACRALAEAGCTVWEIMSITGHTSVKEVEGYVADVNKLKLANSAMAKWIQAS